MRFRTLGLTLSILLALVPGYLRAQAVGEIVGVVADPSGAVVPKVKVTAIQKETALTRSTITSSAGTYSLTTLPVGSYTVSAEAPGFKSASSEVTLDVNQQRDVSFTLALAGTTQQVEVSAAPPLLTTTNATLGGLVTGQQVTTLPLNGRDVTALILLQPGVNAEVNSTWPVSSNPSGNNFVASNGNRGTTGSSFLDGLDTSDNEFGGSQFTNFNLDGLAEFKVLQNNYSAEYGRGSGNIVLLVSKSGTNSLHGSGFEFLRNNVLDARNFFAAKVPPFKRNEFGGTLGGPIRKDKTFFFGEYAGFRQRLGEPTIIPVPTAQERQGIVNIVGANGKPDQLIVPLNSVAQTVANRYPLPNDPSGPYGPRTYNILYSVPQNTNQWSARVDQRFSEKDNLFVRFTYENNKQPILEPNLAVINPSFSAFVGANQRNYGLAETHIFTPTLLNTFRFAYTSSFYPWQNKAQNLAQTSFNDGSLGTWGPDPGFARFLPETYIVNDAVSWTKSRHTISTGAEFRRVHQNGFGASIGGPTGDFLFSAGTPLPVAIPSASGTNNLSAGAPSPNSVVSFLAGAPLDYTRSLPFPGFGPSGGGFAPFGMRRSHYNGWFQDDFRWTPRLTLNFGLRYEYNTVPTEVANRLSGIVDDPHFEGGALFRKLVLNPKPIYYPDYHGFGPRFGLAYRLNSKTVVRGGYAIFTNLPLMQTADQQAGGFPFASFGTRLSPPYSLQPLAIAGLPVVTDLQGNPLPPGGDTKKVPPNTPVNLQPIANFFGGPLLVNFTDMNLHNGYTMAGNITLERQLPGDLAWQVSYVSNNAVGLYASEYPNGYTGSLPQYTPYSIADPGLGEFQLTDGHAHSTYNGLQTQLRKTSPTHGLQFQVSYTWSKTIDNATTVFNGSGTNSVVTPNNPTCYSCEKSTSAFDVPHRFVVNFIYAVPLDKWEALSSAPRRLVEGWQITSIIEAQSGFPFTVSTPFATQEFGIDTYGGVPYARPDLIQEPTLNTGGKVEEQFFSDAAIADAKNLTQKFFGLPGCPNSAQTSSCALLSRPGNLGRNTFRSYPFENVDFSLIKDTKLTERTILQFRSEFFNLFNLHAFGQPGSILTSSQFGVASSTVLPERQIQFALRLIF